MPKQLAVALAVLVLASPVRATHDTRRDFLDDQFELLLPGLTISIFQGFGGWPCDLQYDFITGWGSSICGEFERLKAGAIAAEGMGSDALGALYQITARRITNPASPLCPSDAESAYAVVFEIERRSSSGVELVARVPHCVLTTHEDVAGVSSQITYLSGLHLDSINGRLYLAVRSAALGGAYDGYGVLMISGLPTLLDIIPTFQPATQTLGWVAPKHPEALPAADRFLVYAGDIATLHADGDFTRAVPVDCAVSDSSAPRAGDFLSILDPLPDPAPGQGSYALIGVEYAGQRRFGRQNLGGTLSGRDPSTFGGCG